LQNASQKYLQLSQLGANVFLLAQKLERLLGLFGQALQKRSFQKSSLPLRRRFSDNVRTFSTRKTGERGMKNIQMVMSAGNAMLIPVRT
jgi:hypothetical protein